MADPDSRRTFSRARVSHSKLLLTIFGSNVTLDIRKFHRAVSQTYDTIQAAADWVKRDAKDVDEVSCSFDFKIDADSMTLQWLKENKYL